jgi:DNA-binding beta-propeller fold protein YncE
VGVMLLLSFAFLSFITIIKVVSSPSPGFTFAQSIPKDGNPEIQVIQPEGVDVDPEGNLYVNDIEPNKIIKFSNSGTYILSWGSTGSNDGQFNHPHGNEVDQDGQCI